MLLFGIGHKAQNGKDSLGKYLREKYGFVVYHYGDPLKEEAKLAGWSPENKNESACSVISRLMKKDWVVIYTSCKFNSLRQLHLQCPDVNTVEYEVVKWVLDKGIPNEETGLSYLQWHGTEFRRTQDFNYWVKATFAKIERDRPDRAAICDMRFINEYMAIYENNGQTIDVRRMITHINYVVTHHGEEFNFKQETWIPYIDPERDPNHPSEVQLDGVPHDFNIVASSLDQLYQQADNIMRYLEAMKII